MEKLKTTPDAQQAGGTALADHVKSELWTSNIYTGPGQSRGFVSSNCTDQRCAPYSHLHPCSTHSSWLHTFLIKVLKSLVVGTCICPPPADNTLPSFCNPFLISELPSLTALLQVQKQSNIPPLSYPTQYPALLKLYGFPPVSCLTSKWRVVPALEEIEAETGGRGAKRYNGKEKQAKSVKVND